jgi:hypothetical protein
MDTDDRDFCLHVWMLLLLLRRRPVAAAVPPLSWGEWMAQIAEMSLRLR